MTCAICKQTADEPIQTLDGWICAVHLYNSGEPDLPPMVIRPFDPKRDRKPSDGGRDRKPGELPPDFTPVRAAGPTIHFRIHHEDLTILKDALYTAAQFMDKPTGLRVLAMAAKVNIAQMEVYGIGTL